MSDEKKNCDLSVIIPSYQEEENLRLILPRMRDALDELGCTYEAIVVDTETPLDQTLEYCAEQGMKGVSRRGGNTYGDAIRTGIAESQGESVIIMDADGSHPPEFIGRLFERRRDADVIVASRYIEEGFTENHFSLVLMSRVLNWSYAFVLGINCKDVSNSFKLYPGDTLRSLELKCDNFDLVEEILVKIKRKNKGLNILEIPFTFKQRLFGKTKRKHLAFIATYAFTLVRLRFFV